MRTFKSFWGKIPRPCRVFFNLALSFMIATVFYVSINSPAISAAHQFRRTERANLVGPSNILFNEKVGMYSNSHFIVAETEHGILTFVADNISAFRFNYFNKTGDITFVSAPKHGFLWGKENFAVHLPVFVIDDHPDAVRAELALSIEGTFEYNWNRVEYTQALNQHFHAESEREKDGIFCFTLNLPFIENLDKYGNRLDIGHGADGFALDALSYTFTNRGPRSYDVTITAIIRLYDNNGNLVTEQEQIIDPNDHYWE